MSLMHGSDSGFPNGDDTVTTSASTNPLKVRRTTPHNLMWLCVLHKPFSGTATVITGHGVREKWRQELNYWTLSCWKGMPFSSALPSSLAGTAVKLFVGLCGQAWDLSRWETPPWEVSMVWLSLREALEPGQHTNNGASSSSDGDQKEQGENCLQCMRRTSASGRRTKMILQLLPAAWHAGNSRALVSQSLFLNYPLSSITFPLM